MTNRLAMLSVVVAVGIQCVATSAQAAEKKAAKSSAAKTDAKEAPPEKLSGRLPTHYAKLVTDEQRQEIYEVQAEYAKKADALEQKLKQELAKLSKERDAAVKDVLSKEQQAELEKIASGTKSSSASKTSSSAKKAPAKKSTKATASSKSKKSG